MSSFETLASDLPLGQFDIDPIRGFLPAADPMRRLPIEFEQWEAIASELPKWLMSDRIRNFIGDLPPFPTDRLAGERELRRAMLLLSYLGHAYVWGEHSCVDRIPAVLAVPWHSVATKLGRPPILSYASYALDNWFRLDPDGPIACGNIALAQNFLGGADEEWFILIHVDIEAKVAAAIVAISRAHAASARGNDAELQFNLETIVESMAQAYSTLTRMPDHCDPYIYFHRVRPYIHGWKNNPTTPNGMIYEGVAEYDGKPQTFHGETGAQSSIIPSLDALLGVEHESDPLKEYLVAMRNYMPPKHRAFIAALESGPPLRNVVKQGNCPPILRQLYDECVSLVERFRSLHLEYAATYIFKQAQTEASNPSAIGTGGTPFMKYLKKHRDETTQHLLGEGDS